MKLEIVGTFSKNIKFFESPSIGCRFLPCEQTHRKLIVAFRTSGKAPNKKRQDDQLYRQKEVPELFSPHTSFVKHSAANFPRELLYHLNELSRAGLPSVEAICVAKGTFPLLLVVILLLCE